MFTLIKIVITNNVIAFLSGYIRQWKMNTKSKVGLWDRVDL